MLLELTTITLCVFPSLPWPARGRRRLDFKRFLGKAMFLDLPGYRHAHKLEEELTARGAVSEGEGREGGREGRKERRREGRRGEGEAVSGAESRGRECEAQLYH